MEKQKVVLLTGGSSGIGLELATQLMQKGMRVYSASRSIGISQKEPDGTGEIIPVKMDVNNDTDIASVISQILDESGQLDAVICNAGNGIAGAVEDTSIDEAKYQFETNFFGVVRTITSCLSVFRKQGFGRIIVNSSMAAVVPIPFQAFYTASKTSLLTFMQALSIEVKPFGIQCCTILPGDVKTGFTASRKYAEKSTSGQSVYSGAMNKAVKKMEQDEENGMQASAIAREMLKQVLRKRMSEVVVPGFSYKLIYSIFYFIPMRLRLWIIGKIY